MGLKTRAQCKMQQSCMSVMITNIRLAIAEFHNPVFKCHTFSVIVNRWIWMGFFICIYVLKTVTAVVNCPLESPWFLGPSQTTNQNFFWQYGITLHYIFLHCWTMFVCVSSAQFQQFQVVFICRMMNGTGETHLAGSEVVEDPPFPN